MTQRWRQQTVAFCRLIRATSAQRGVANLQMMAAECAALAHDARADGSAELAAYHRMEADWFAAEADRRAVYLPIFPGA